MAQAFRVRSLDTNILVRAIVRDDDGQTAQADRSLAEPAMVTATVLVEMVWVLESTFDLSRAAICNAFEDLLELPDLLVQNRSAIVWSTQRYAQGADFADMCHIALSGAADRFTTFDRGIARHSAGAVIPVETLRP